ncbi:cytoplasm to vacuole targeting protein-like protein Vps64 [Bisporella sp. PMI_857]|nr:cytoplasm to vacuole targeting protein-like protein Vps64 [Bisporella sp. PMI_857]
MTAVASPPSFQQNNRAAWSANISQGGLTAMNADEVSRMFMPRKSAQRSNSSSSISSTSSASSSTTVAQALPQTNGAQMSAVGDLSSWGTAAARKKPQRTGPWPTSKAEAMSGVTTARPQSILSTNGASAASSITSIHQPPILPSQHLQNPTQQVNGNRPNAPAVGEGNPVLYLLSMNGTFERKTISVPYYPDHLRIGRQTNAKTIPTPANGFFDSKVLSRQHAEIWADRNGKIWIRDIKSSNGTFVNGARLSPENRDSEPHELQTQDHLELGIDIVSEDQKTVVHHKVAAKVEHAGYLGTTNNVLDMNFGDLDPANGAMMVPSQGAMQLRNRTGSQGSVASSGRMGPPSSIAGSQMSIMAQQRPMNFWLTPVTTEQIVKRLTHEMRVARLQTSDLGRTDQFFGALLSKDHIKEGDRALATENKAPQTNGVISAMRADPKTRFSEPPAPPPQQPLPEKPDVARSHPFDTSSPASLKRSNTERPRSVPTVSPVRQEPTSQIISLVEALATAKKELEAQGARLRDLEESLQKERRARELAEEVAKQLEIQAGVPTTTEDTREGADTSILEEAFEPPLERSDAKNSEESEQPKEIDTKAIAASTALLEQHLEKMALEMQNMKDHMESFKTRAEKAEAERDNARITLAQMVEKIRLNESARSSSTERARSPARRRARSQSRLTNGDAATLEMLESLVGKATLENGNAITAGKEDEFARHLTGTLSRPPGGHDPLLYHTTPYASILGVVLIGMGLMAYLNGWQPPKVER